MSISRRQIPGPLPEAPPPGGESAGFNFRETQAGDTDGPLDYYCGFDPQKWVWPTDFTGKDLNVRAGFYRPLHVAGFAEPSWTGGWRDFTNTDVRLAGSVSNAASSYAFRVELLPGTYRVWGGLGAAGDRFAYGQWQIYDGLDLSDTGDLTLEHDTGVLIPPNSTLTRAHFTGTYFSDADWAANYDLSYVTVTVTARGANTGLNFWTRFNTYAHHTAHFRVELTA